MAIGVLIVSIRHNNRGQKETIGAIMRVVVSVVVARSYCVSRDTARVTNYGAVTKSGAQLGGDAAGVAICGARLGASDKLRHMVSILTQCRHFGTDAQSQLCPGLDCRNVDTG